jgi:hypothetical protein
VLGCANAQGLCRPFRHGARAQALEIGAHCAAFAGSPPGVIGCMLLQGLLILRGSPIQLSR